MTKKQWTLWSSVIPYPIVFTLSYFCATLFWDDKTYLEAFTLALISGLSGGLVLFVLWYFSPESWWE